MRFINTISLAPSAKNWLTNSRHPRILHIFDRACNLINERGEVLSVVTQQIGNGPFNMVIEEDVCLAGHLSLDSAISSSPSQLALGEITIHTMGAELWNPCPDWNLLHSQKEMILFHLAQLPNATYPFPHSNFSNSLLSSLIIADLPSSLVAARNLAGRGVGLTPSGDDFLVGAMYGTWIIHSPEVADNLAREITETAAPLTTSLSAAWLRSAGRGEAGILWHGFFKALITGRGLDMRIAGLLSVGETSGVDALAGFFGVMSACNERIIDECPS